MKRYRVAVFITEKDIGIGIERYEDQKINEIMSLYFPERLSLVGAYILAIDLIAERSMGEPIFIKVFHAGVDRILTERCAAYSNNVKIRKMKRKAEPTVMMLARDAVYRQSSVREILN